MPENSTELLAARLFRVVRVFQKTAEGKQLPREIIRHPGAAVIVPILETGHVCLIKNYRVAVEKTLIELPAGTLDSGEDPLQTAQRELIEETGFHAQNMTPLLAFHPSPGILDEQMHLYLATGLTSGKSALEPGEQIENLIVTWDEAMQLVDRGEIQDAKTLVGLLLYDRLRKAT